MSTKLLRVERLGEDPSRLYEESGGRLIVLRDRGPVADLVPVAELVAPARLGNVAGLPAWTRR